MGNRRSYINYKTGLWGPKPKSRKRRIRKKWAKRWMNNPKAAAILEDGIGSMWTVGFIVEK